MLILNQIIANRFADVIGGFTSDIIGDLDFHGLGANSIKVSCDLMDGEGNELVVKVKFKGFVIDPVVRV